MASRLKATGDHILPPSPGFLVALISRVFSGIGFRRYCDTLYLDFPLVRAFAKSGWREAYDRLQMGVRQFLNGSLHFELGVL